MHVSVAEFNARTSSLRYLKGDFVILFITAEQQSENALSNHELTRSLHGLLFSPSF